MHLKPQRQIQRNDATDDSNIRIIRQRLVFFAAPSQKHSIYFFTSEKSMSLRYNTGCQSRRRRALPQVVLLLFLKPPNRKRNVGETLWIDGNCWFVPFTWLKMHRKAVLAWRGSRRNSLPLSVKHLRNVRLAFADSEKMKHLTALSRGPTPFTE